jgi:hypothetical protein
VALLQEEEEEEEEGVVRHQRHAVLVVNMAVPHMAALHMTAAAAVHMAVLKHNMAVVTSTSKTVVNRHSSGRHVGMGHLHSLVKEEQRQQPQLMAQQGMGAAVGRCPTS